MAPHPAPVWLTQARNIAMEKYQCPSGQQAEKRSENDSFSHRTQGQASAERSASTLAGDILPSFNNTVKSEGGKQAQALKTRELLRGHIQNKESDLFTEIKEDWFSKAMSSVRFTGAVSAPSQLPKYGFSSPDAKSSAKYEKFGRKICCCSLGARKV
ncbi:hypothetical protein Anapl_14603 [Anas platyrhynchos]|uniref:Uncharacterized protein n=1 Tax=Anas platyrhynchos TaxID=8839 RepID=R0KXJ5_ANAPL|nr:hypothetical protein Anapl_14603 [Anas platyrhynchos]